MNRIDRRRFLKAAGMISLAGSLPFVGISNAMGLSRSLGLRDTDTVEAKDLDLESGKVSVVLIGSVLSDADVEHLSRFINLKVYRAEVRRYGDLTHSVVLSMMDDGVLRRDNLTDFEVMSADVVLIVGDHDESGVTEAMETYSEIVKQFDTHLIGLTLTPSQKGQKHLSAGYHRVVGKVDGYISVPTNRLALMSGNIRGESISLLRKQRYFFKAICEVCSFPAHSLQHIQDYGIYGVGYGSGKERVEKATMVAMARMDNISENLHHINTILVKVTGGFDLTQREMEKNVDFLRRRIPTDVSIIQNSSRNFAMKERVQVSVVVTET